MREGFSVVCTGSEEPPWFSELRVSGSVYHAARAVGWGGMKGFEIGVLVWEGVNFRFPQRLWI